jgi:hypothetical protein
VGAWGLRSVFVKRSSPVGARSVERRTRMRAEWMSGGTMERYFDYVVKKSTKIAREIIMAEGRIASRLHRVDPHTRSDSVAA